MLKKLLSVFVAHDPLSAITHNFREMLQLTQEMTLAASDMYWAPKPCAERMSQLRRQDVRVNKLEREIRQQVATHLTIARSGDAAYCLLMMSLVKDVERIGDYAKNLAEAAEMFPVTIPEDPLANALRQVRSGVADLARQIEQVFIGDDAEAANQLTVVGRTLTKRCDDLLQQMASADYPAGLAVKIALAARFYKRLTAHFLNVLSSVIMPLHKLDYYDEDIARGWTEASEASSASAADHWL